MVTLPHGGERGGGGLMGLHRKKLGPIDEMKSLEELADVTTTTIKQTKHHRFSWSVQSVRW